MSCFSFVPSAYLSSKIDPYQIEKKKHEIACNTSTAHSSLHKIAYHPSAALSYLYESAKYPSAALSYLYEIAN